MTKPKKKKPQPQSPQPRSEKTASVGKRYFAKRYFITGFGQVEIGDLVTPEALIAWNGTTEPKSTQENAQ